MLSESRKSASENFKVKFESEIFLIWRNYGLFGLEIPQNFPRIEIFDFNFEPRISCKAKFCTSNFLQY
jgi:hypothetical protein